MLNIKKNNFNKNMFGFFRSRRTQTQTPIPKATIVEKELVKQRFPITVVEEPEISPEIEELLHDFSELSEYRNNTRKTDDEIEKICRNKELQRDLDYFISSFLQKRLNSKSFLNKPEFVANVLKDLDISIAQYLSLTEIALFILFLNEYLSITTYSFTSFSSAYYRPIDFVSSIDIETPSYDKTAKIFEIIFDDIYYTFDIDYPIYNSLMKEMDEELKRLKQSHYSDIDKIKGISRIYIDYLIDCLLLTPLTKMGDYNNTIAFFKNYLAFLSIVKNSEYNKNQNETLDKLIPKEWKPDEILSRSSGGGKNKKF